MKALKLFLGFVFACVIFFSFVGIISAFAKGVSNPEIPFFYNSENFLNDQLGDLNDFDEVPIQLNDYGLSTEKCSSWRCTNKRESATNVKGVYCSGNWSCSQWNGIACAQYNCSSWTTAATSRRDFYCNGGYTCDRWNGTVCAVWKCNALVMGGATPGNDFNFYCAGVWNCSSFSEGKCNSWNCTNWSYYGTIRADYSCSDGWNCINFLNNSCNTWNCTGRQTPIANYDYYCAGILNCTSWNGNVCGGWKCTNLTNYVSQDKDIFCGGWNCTNWDESKKVCGGWNCTNWTAASATKLDVYCGGTYNCDSWKTFSYAPAIALISPTNITYNNRTQLVNISTSGASSIWFYNGTANVTYTSPVLVGFSEGSNTIIAYANDSAGNVNSTQTIFVIDTTSPAISIISPANTTYNSGTVFLNYTVSDSSGVNSCWYSIDTGANITLAGCSTASISGFIEGSHRIRISANDSVGNINSSSLIFSIDSTIPAISIISPVNTTYNSATQLINISSSGASNIWFYNGTANVTYTVPVSVEFPEGSNTIIAYANDSAGNINSSSVTFSKDTSAPFWSNMMSSVSLNYSSSVSSFFNITWVGNPQTVLLESNFSGISRNYTMQLISGNSYGFNTILPAGTFYWKSYANDSRGNLNSSPSELFTVAKAVPSLGLLLDNIASDKAVDYAVQTEAKGSESNNGDGDLIYELYMAGNLVTTGSLVYDVQILGAGTFVYTYNTTGGENYTFASITRILTVNRGSSSIALYLNGIEQNASQIYGTASNITARGINGDVILYKDGINISDSEFAILGSGIYNYTALISESENISGSIKTFFLSINKASPILSLLINGTDSDRTITPETVITINASSVIPAGFSVNLYEEDSLIAIGITPSTIVNYSSGGDKIWKVNISESENYTSAEATHTLSVVDLNFPQYSDLKESPTDPASYFSNNIYFLNATWTDISGISEVILQFDGINYSLSNGGLLREGDVYSSPFFEGLAAGNYNYKWLANDTDDNWVATTTQTYTIDRAITALFLILSPSNNLAYGSTADISCSANNIESSPIITRNVTPISNPSSEILTVGTHNYACITSQTQNYTSASTTGILTILKASPVINLTLNNANSDLSLGSSGGEVNITAELVNPSYGNLNITQNNVVINSGASPLFSSINYSNSGNYIIIASYPGNNNYTSGSISYTITVQEAQQSSGSGSHGGGGSRTIIITDLSNATMGKCLENWTCTNWTECSSDGLKVRACTDSNNCRTSLSRPSEIRSCQKPTCMDGIRNQEEFGIDCGGPCAKRCDKIELTGQNLVELPSSNNNNPSPKLALCLIFFSGFIALIMFINRTEMKINEQKLAGDVDFKKMNFKLLVAHIIHALAIIVMFIILFWVVIS
jgi:hypothetical protein